MKLRPGAAVRVRTPYRFPGATGVVVSVSRCWVTVAVGWSERRTLPRRDVLAVITNVGPLRPGGIYDSARMLAMFEGTAPLWPDNDGPGGGPEGDGEPFPVPRAA